MGKPGWERGVRTLTGKLVSSISRNRVWRGDPDPRGYDRSDRRAQRYADDTGWRGSSAGRSAAGWNRRSSNGQSAYSDYDRNSGRNRVPGRDEYAAYGRDPRQAGGYDGRGQRVPPARGWQQDAWGATGRGGSYARPRVVAGIPDSSMGGRQSLDELRARRLRQQGLDEDDEGFTASKAFMVVLLMLLLGA